MDSHTSKAVGTLAYMSLEAIAGSFQPHVDIWALGVMAVEMASAAAPTDLLRKAAQVAEYVRTVPTTFSQNFSNAVCSCLEMDPGKRPTAAQLKDSAVAFIVPMISASFKDLHAAVDKAAWARPSQVQGLEWAVKSVGDGHSVKLADCSDQASPTQQQAVHELLELVSAAGSETLSFHKLQRVVLVWSRARAGQLIAKMMDLNFKYANKTLFSLEQRIAPRLGSAIDVDARRRTLQWFHDTYRSLMPDYQHVRTLLAFHATTSEEIAEQVREAA